MSRLPSAPLMAAVARSVSFQPKSGAAVVAEIELREVAVQVGLAAKLIDAGHAALEHGEHVLDRV